MIGQQAVVQTLSNAITRERISQAYIFSGMRGVGKTTAARILAKALNCEHGPIPVPCNKCAFCREIDEDRSLDVIEIDGASNTGVDDVRSLREGIQYKPINCRNKVIIIDEFHMLSKSAFNALLKTLEEPPPNTVFIFATTEFNKVPPTIVSRCQHFEFKRISRADIIKHLAKIAAQENITISSAGLSLIAEAADGSLRDSQSLLDQAVAFSGENIQEADLKEILGTVNREILFQFSSAVFAEKPDAVFALVAKVTDSGYDVRMLHEELIRHFRDLLIITSIADPSDLLAYGEEEMKILRAEAEKSSPDDLLRYLNSLQQEEQKLRYSSHPRIFFEVLLLRLCLYKQLVPVKDLINKLKEIKTVDLDPPNPTAAADGDSSPPKPETTAESRKKNPAQQPLNSEKTKVSKPPEKPGQETNKILKDPAVQNFMDTFKAQIVSVKQKKVPENSE